MKRDIRIKRVYEPAEPGDGTRVLVDRIWPRGIKKEDLQAEWLKEVSPSSALRKQFHHEPALWEEFKERFFAELDDHPGAVARLLELAGDGTLTLLYAAKEETYNNAAALREYLMGKAQK